MSLRRAQGCPPRPSSPYAAARITAAAAICVVGCQALLDFDQKAADARAPSADSDGGLDAETTGPDAAPIDATTADKSVPPADAPPHSPDANFKEPPGPTPGQIDCAGLSCSSTNERCCWSDTTPTCIHRSYQCPGTEEVAILCDETSDCEVGSTCCVQTYNSVNCLPGGCGGLPIACRTSADCSGGRCLMWPCGPPVATCNLVGFSESLCP